MVVHLYTPSQLEVRSSFGICCLPAQAEHVLRYLPSLTLVTSVC